MAKKKRDNKQLNIEDRYEEVRQLLILGKDRGYLTLEEINEMLPDELNTSPEEIEEVFSLLDTNAIDLVDAETKEVLTRSHTPADHVGSPTSSASWISIMSDPCRTRLRRCSVLLNP